MYGITVDSPLPLPSVADTVLRIEGVDLDTDTHFRNSDAIESTHLEFDPRGKALVDFFRKYVDRDPICDWKGRVSSGLFSNVVMFLWSFIELITCQISIDTFLNQDFFLLWVSTAFTTTGSLTSPLSILVGLYAFTAIATGAICLYVYGFFDMLMMANFLMSASAFLSKALLLTAGFKDAGMACYLFLQIMAYVVYIIRGFIVLGPFYWIPLVQVLSCVVILIAFVLVGRVSRYYAQFAFQAFIVFGALVLASFMVESYLNIDFKGLPVQLLFYIMLGLNVLCAGGLVLLRRRAIRVATALGEMDKKAYDDQWKIISESEAEYVAILRSCWDLAMSKAIPKEKFQSNEEGYPATIADLFDQADLVNPFVQSLIKQWAQQTNGTRLPRDGRALGIKGAARSVQKIYRSYKGDFRYLCDVVRGSLEFETLEDLCRCLDIIREDPNVVLLKTDESKFRLRDSYDSSVSLGYRDVQLSMVLSEVGCARVQKLTKILEARVGATEGTAVGALLGGFVFEVQLHHRRLQEIKSDRGHQVYKRFRNIKAE